VRNISKISNHHSSIGIPSQLASSQWVGLIVEVRKQKKLEPKWFEL
jgi:hypothetical protein